MLIITQTGGLSPASGTIIVNSTSSLPSPPFTITIGNESLIVTKVVGNQLYVQRGTPAVFHPNGATINIGGAASSSTIQQQAVGTRSIVGPAGPQGPAGSAGPIGPPGPIGATGPANSDASMLRGRLIATSVPTLYAVPAYDGSQYIPMQLSLDMVLPSFVISSFTTSPTLIEVGASSVTPVFTAAFSTTPDSAPNSVVLTDNYGTPAKDVSATPTTFSSDGTFVRNAYGQTVVFTLTANKSAVTRTSNLTMTWTQKVFWGVGGVGPLNEVQIEALANSALATSRARTITLTPGAGEYIWYCFRNAYGAATFTVGGFEGGFEAPIIVSITNPNGFTENYYAYRSTNPNLGATTVVVS